MKFSEVKDMTVDELQKRLKSKKIELFETKMKHSLGQIANPLVVRDLRRDIARVKTAINQKLAE